MGAGFGPLFLLTNGAMKMITDRTKNAANQFAGELNADCVVTTDTNEVTDWLDGDDNDFRQSLENAIDKASNEISETGATEAYVMIRIRPASGAETEATEATET